MGISRREAAKVLGFLGIGALGLGSTRSLLAAPSGPLDTGPNQTHGPFFEQWLPKKTGITWKHDNALSALRYLPESMGSGVAIFDYDNDGWMDLYFVNSGPADFFHPDKPLRNALYRNNRDGTFTDVTLTAGVSGKDFGIGVAAADFDADGWTDLLITTYGRLIL